MFRLIPTFSVVMLLACTTTDDSKTTSTDDNINNTDTENTETVTTPLSEQGQWAAQYHEDISGIVQGEEEFNKLNALEALVEKAEDMILKPWILSWKTGSFNEYQALFVENAPNLNWAAGQITEQRDFSGIKELSWVIAEGSDSSSQYLASFSSIEDFDLKVSFIEEQSDKLLLTLEYDLRAIRTDSFRQQDRGHITITTDLDCKKILSMQASTMERMIAQRSPAFVDRTQEIGLGVLPIVDRKEAIRRGGYALVVADYDQDGNIDMLVGNYGPINLMRNTGSGFEDVTVAAGLDAEEVIKGAGFVDMDNDGDRDITMLRFTDSTDPRGDFVIYENNGDGTFTKHTDLLPRRRSYDTPMPLSMGDYNNDGFIDIYIGFPGIRDFTSGIATQDRPEWLASQGIWFNQGNWVFTEAEDDNAIVQDNDTYSHAAASTDLDGDGWLDLLVVDDSGRINPVFRNNGGGEFVQLGEESGLTHAGMSMGVTTGDFNNDGHLDIMSSHVALNAGRRMGYSMEGIAPEESSVGQLMKHIRDQYADVQLFINNGDGTFTDTTATSNLNWAGEAAGAGEWIDYNHDGLLDYYLPNGLWSSGEKSFDSVFFRAELLLYGTSILGGEEGEVSFDLSNDVHGGAIFSKSEEGGSNPVLTMLQNHRADGDAPLTYSFSGHQRNAMFRNNGDGTFTEVGFLEGVDRIEDGYIMAPVDYNGDGKQDMVLRNTDPALEQSFSPVIALENQLPGNTIIVSLHSTQGNTDGLGARVTAYVGDSIISREIRSVNGAVQAEPVAYIGLGDAVKADRIVVTWPGGTQQEVLNIEKGAVTIERQ